MELKNEKIFITGGAGYLGKALIKRWYNTNHITVYSRDEAKHYLLKKEYPNVNFIIGDIRNRDLLIRSTKNHSIGVFAASLKQIEACEQNYEEAEQIIVQGSFNSKIAAIENDFKAAAYIATDKCIYPTTIYGISKALAAESFIIRNTNSNVKLSSIIYGNILNSTGSIIPVIWDFIKNNKVLELYGEEMTRFFLTVDDACTLIENSLECEGVITIPNIRSFRIKDLFDIYTQFGLKYNITKPRDSEKIHELMAGHEHIPRMQFLKDKDMYIMYKQRAGHNLKFPHNEYSSQDFCINKDELDCILQKFEYFKG